MEKDILMREWDEIKGIIDDELRKIQNEIIFPVELRDAAFYLINAGGKRIRPFILMMSAAMFNIPYNISLPAAISIELLHNFTLIHDDIMDKDEFRRGVPTTHIMYGEPIAILAGDFLFSHLYTYLIKSYLKLGIDRNVIVNIALALSEAMDNICYGQVMDLMSNKYIKTINDYMKMVYYKTAALIEAATYIGGLLGTASLQYLNNLRIFGKNIGIAFQIADDILGLYGDTKVTGKPVGNDIKMGKHTILVIMALENMSNVEKQKFSQVFGNINASVDEVKQVIEIFDKYNIREKVTNIMENLVDRAIFALSKLPDNKYKKILEKLSYFIIYREK